MSRRRPVIDDSPRTQTNREFIEAVEERLGDGLETYSGDRTDWSEDGIGSGARPLGFNRRAQASVGTAQTLRARRRARRRRGGRLGGARDGLRERGPLRRAHLGDRKPLGGPVGQDELGRPAVGEEGSVRQGGLRRTPGRWSRPGPAASRASSWRKRSIRRSGLVVVT